MSQNPILDELRAAREKLLTDAGGDFDRLVAGIRQRQATSGHKVISGRVGESRKTYECTDVVETAVRSGK